MAGEDIHHLAHRVKILPRLEETAVPIIFFHFTLNVVSLVGLLAYITRLIA